MSASGDGGRELAVLRSAEVGEAVPREVLVAPWGHVDSANGRFVVDEEGARLAIAAFEAQGTDLPIDYEHQTLGGGYASPSGQAPAAGWIKRLFMVRPVGSGRGSDEATEGSFAKPQDRLRDGGGDGRAAGLYADVEWTEPAREQLAARQYRYLSPVAIVRKGDRRLVALHSAALTNKPAIVGMKPIINKEDLAQRREDAERSGIAECGMRISEGVRVCAGPSAIGNAQCAVDELRNSRLEDHSMTEVLGRLRGQLGLEGTAEGEEVLAAASARITSLTEAAQRGEAEARVAAATEAGKLTEAQQAWAIALAMRDPAAFEAWEASAPVVVQVGRLDGTAADDGRAFRGAGEGERDKVVIAAKARAEFRANPELELLTSEEAYVALAVREANRPAE